MHAANHPESRHYISNVWDVDPRKACGKRPVGLMWLSPDCTFFSKARGGKPFRDPKKARRRRGLASLAVRWAAAVRPRVIAMENVEEFKDWCPLTDKGLPDWTRAGFSFRRWVRELENLGYKVEWRELRACDFGAPTTRKRLFIIARCDGQPIAWPSPTHGPGRPLPYRTAADCIDWTVPVRSIFGRKKPLADKTLARIARGLWKYVLNNGNPFIVPVTHGGGEGRAHSIDEPLKTVTGARRGEMALVAPSLIQTGWGERKGQAPRALDIHKPVGTLMAEGNKHALVSAFLARHFGGHENDGAAAQMPLPTVTARDHHALVTANLLKLYGTSTGADVREPAPTVTGTGQHIAEVRAFLMAYYATDQDPQLSMPMHTVTTKARFGLVTVHGVEYQIVDIGMRMLTPRELFRAQGFPDTYVIGGKGDALDLTQEAQIRMCGNSVCPPLAAALIRANCLDLAVREAA
jgi:DNA (cytosine-5)-methyltransferase 1